MTDQPSQQALEIFLQAIELDDSKRFEYIKESCAGSQGLIDEVKQLLETEQASGDFFKALEGAISNSQLNEIEEHCFRDFHVGPYQIKNVIKQGGMGSIFLAQRADGEFEREVIIKMMPIDLNFDKNKEMFAHEKEILASLIHPNIVQLYDSGITQSGQSYFVMELVNGTHIVDYCNERKLSCEERIELFLQVLKAIQFAHQHLVIHGDIKPSNIMVNEDGEVKLLDFGIARMMHQHHAEIKGYSIDYKTPEHEQGKKVITSTDIHQLGQLLFELLTQTPPNMVNKSGFQWPSLSQFLHQASAQKSKLINRISDKTQTSNRRLKKLFKSDFQTVVAKALEPIPTDRYQTAQSFTDDLLNYQQGYCVNARQSSVAYRFNTYIKRHKLLVFFTVVMALLLGAFAFMTKLHNQALSIERDKAVTVKDLLVDVFNVADPAMVPGKELSATEVLDIGLERVRESFATPTEVEADLLEEIAQTYQNLGNYTTAQKVLEDAHKIRTGLSNQNPTAVAKGMLLLGENERLMAHHEQAENWLNKALEMFQTNSNANQSHIASTKSKLGRVKMLQGHFDEAERLGTEATQLHQQLYGKYHISTAQSMNDLTAVYFRQGKYAQVEEILLDTKQIREHLWGDQPIPILDKDYATNINNLGLANYLLGNLERGEQYFLQAIELRNQIFTSAHPEQAQSLTNLGLLLNDAGRPNEALPYLQQALEIRQLTLEPGHMRINDAWNNLAMVYHENAEFSKAITIYQDISDPIIAARGVDHPQTASVYTNMANTLLELNEFQQAHDMLQKSLEIRQKTLPADHLYLSYSYLGLGRTKVALGELDTGRQLIQQALDIRQQKLPPDHWLLGETNYALSMVKFIQNQPDEPLTRQACDTLHNKKGSANFLTKKCMILLQKITDRMP